MSTEALSSKEELEKIIRKALIEVYVMKETGNPLDHAMSACKTGEGREDFVERFRDELERAYFVPGQHGQPATLAFASDEEFQEEVQEIAQEERTELEHTEVTPVAEVLEATTHMEDLEKGTSDSPAEDMDVVGEGTATDLSEVEATSMSRILEETLGTSPPTDAWRNVSISDLEIKFAVSSPSPNTLFLSLIRFLTTFLVLTFTMAPSSPLLTNYRQS